MFFTETLVPWYTFLRLEILFLTPKHKRSKVDKVGVSTALKTHRQKGGRFQGDSSINFYDTCSIYDQP